MDLYEWNFIQIRQSYQRNLPWDNMFWISIHRYLLYIIVIIYQYIYQYVYVAGQPRWLILLSICHNKIIE